MQYYRKLKTSCEGTVHVQLPLWLSTIYENIAGVEGNLHTFLFSALGGGEWSDSCSDHFTVGKELWEISA
jgi:hypothetical protein